MSATYRPATAAESFRRVLRGEDPRLALGDFLDDWRRTPAARRIQLVRDPLDEAGSTADMHRWAAFFAATVDQLSADSQQEPPSWTSRPEYRLAEPWFLVRGWALRAEHLVRTPVPFRMRNIFGGEDLLERA